MHLPGGDCSETLAGSPSYSNCRLLRVALKPSCRLRHRHPGSEVGQLEVLAPKKGFSGNFLGAAQQNLVPGTHCFASGPYLTTFGFDSPLVSLSAGWEHL